MTAPETGGPPGRGWLATRIQFARYLVLGGINFFLTLAVFTGLLHLTAVGYLLALGLSWFAGMLFMYVTNFLWVFRQNGGLRFDARFLRFFGVGLLSITANMAALSAIVEGWGTDPFLTQLALMPFVVLFNFTATRLFSLRQDQLRNDDPA